MNKAVVAIGVVILFAGIVSVAYSDSGDIGENLLAGRETYVSTASADAKILFNLDEMPSQERYVVELVGPTGDVAVKQQQEITVSLQSIGVQVNRQYNRVANAVTVTGSPSQIEQVAALGQVKRVYRDQLLKGINIEPSASMLAASYASDLDLSDYDGSGTMIMILDTGVNSNLPEFQRDGESIVTASFSVFNEQYTHWHGTHIGNIIGGQGSGDASIGLAPGVNLGSVCCFDDNGEAYLSDILDGLEYVVHWKNTHNEFVVASCSWGIEPGVIPCSPGNPGIVCSSVANLAKRYNIPVVASSGNSGPSSSSINHPAASPHVIAVGAVNQYKEITSFSSRGPVTNLGEVKPDIVAYGYNIESIDENGNPRTASGTSFSCPMVTAVVAQLAEKYADAGYEPLNYEKALESSAVDLGTTGPDDTYGSGFANATGAFTALGGQTPPSDTFFTGGLLLMAIGGVVTGTGVFTDKRKRY